MPVCLLLAGCIEGNTEQEQIRVVLSPLFYSGVHTPSSLKALLGSQACFHFGLMDVKEQNVLAPDAVACVDATIAGVPVHEGDCMVLDELGPLQIDFTPRAGCPFPEVADSLVTDRFEIEVVPGGELRAGFEWYIEHSALRWLTSAGELPADLIPAADEPLRLVPGVEVVFPINLIDAAGERVAWDLTQGLASESRDGGPGRELPRVEDIDSQWRVSIGPGEHSMMTFEIGGEVLPLAEVVATPAEEAASIEVVAGYFGELPFGARAIVRDGEGHVIYGAPVAWSLVEGELALGPLEGGAPPEYTVIEDGCLPPPTSAEPRRAILRAQLGALSDEFELEWTVMPPETASEEPFEPYKSCVRGTNTPDDPAGPGQDDDLGDRGCNCAATPGAGLGGWAWLLLLAFGWRRGRTAQG
ncbi:hypothetical protein [Nannocystis radixulma]|uniref:MYXO-CTERM domain-containing protein n=1 Tax=Nannocystis radixulma TaxID=2995305 RepID=A0ABT5BMV4_9BACT|nr:hypothetical protein [Nannocystis radixulma]MDC0675500.1 hypothetical protein [Nannocystis radixulma]